jgi:hypothetical protein
MRNNWTIESELLIVNNSHQCGAEKLVTISMNGALRIFTLLSKLHTKNLDNTRLRWTSAKCDVRITHATQYRIRSIGLKRRVESFTCVCGRESGWDKICCARCGAQD